MLCVRTPVQWGLWGVGWQRGKVPNFDPCGVVYRKDLVRRREYRLLDWMGLWSHPAGLFLWILRGCVILVHFHDPLSLSCILPSLSSPKTYQALHTQSEGKG